MRNPTPISMLGSVLVANGLNLGWGLLILANILWLIKYKTDNNKDGMSLHGFYLANSVYAFITHII